MKCREGCEGEAVVRPVCWQCWQKLPPSLTKAWFLANERTKAQVAIAIKNRLAADDKRRAE